MQELLDKYKIKIDYNTLLAMWNEPQRHYHNQTHLIDLFNQINEYKKTKNCSQKEYEKLILCAIFHDCIYDPKNANNEEMSSEFFLNCCEDKNKDISDINQMILDTKTHEPNLDLSETFNFFDMNVCERNYDDLLQWEEGIHKEYQVFGNEAYKKGRIQFLESILDRYINNTENLLKLIDYVKIKY